MSDIVERLRPMSVSQANSVELGSWEVAKLLDEAADTIEAERALADALADALENLWKFHAAKGDYLGAPMVGEALARYRQARGRG